MILKEKISFISRSLNFLERNPNKSKIWIRDLYHKVFPSKEKYIQFIRKHHSTLQNINKSEKNKYIELIKRKTSTKFIVSNLNDKDHIFDKDNFWNDISSLDTKRLELFLMEWFINKSKKDRKLWNYYILGISEGRIAILLNDNFYSTRKKVLELKKDFLRNLMTIIGINNKSKD